MKGDVDFHLIVLRLTVKRELQLLLPRLEANPSLM